MGKKAKSKKGKSKDKTKPIVVDPMLLSAIEQTPDDPPLKSPLGRIVDTGRERRDSLKEFGFVQIEEEEEEEEEQESKQKIVVDTTTVLVESKSGKKKKLKTEDEDALLSPGRRSRGRRTIAASPARDTKNDKSDAVPPVRHRSRSRGKKEDGKAASAAAVGAASASDASRRRRNGSRPASRVPSPREEEELTAEETFAAVVSPRIAAIVGVSGMSRRRNQARRATTAGAFAMDEETNEIVATESPRNAQVVAAEKRVASSKKRLDTITERRKELEGLIGGHTAKLKASTKSIEKAHLQAELSSYQSESDGKLLELMAAREALGGAEQALERAKKRAATSSKDVSSRHHRRSYHFRQQDDGEDNRAKVLKEAEERAAARKAERPVKVDKAASSKRRTRRRKDDEGKKKATTMKAKKKKPSPKKEGAKTWKPGQRISLSLFTGTGDVTAIKADATTLEDEDSSHLSAESQESDSSHKTEGSADEQHIMQYSAASEVAMTPRALARHEAQQTVTPEQHKQNTPVAELMSKEVQAEAAQRASMHLANMRLQPLTLGADGMSDMSSPRTPRTAHDIRASRALSVIFDAPLVFDPAGQVVEVPICSICEDDAKWPATVRCHQCDLRYCTECLKFAHPHRGLLKHHVLLPIDNEPPPPVPEEDVVVEAPDVPDAPVIPKDVPMVPPAVPQDLMMAAPVVPEDIASLPMIPQEPSTNAPKEDAPKEDAPKEDAPKEDAPKEDAPKAIFSDADAPQLPNTPVPAPSTANTMPGKKFAALGIAPVPSVAPPSTLSSDEESATNELDVATWVGVDYGKAEPGQGKSTVWLYVTCAIDEADGETIWVTGSTPELGDFVESRAFKLSKCPEAGTDVWGAPVFSEVASAAAADATLAEADAMLAELGLGDAKPAEAARAKDRTLRYRLLVLGPVETGQEGLLAPADKAGDAAVRRRSSIRTVELPSGADGVFVYRVHDDWPGESPESTYLANAMFRRVWCNRGTPSGRAMPTVPACPKGHVLVTFAVLCTTLPRDATVYLTGNVAALGNNDEGRAVPMDDAGHPRWAVTVPVPIDEEDNVTVTYSYFYRSATKMVREDGHTRVLSARRGRAEVDRVLVEDGDFRSIATVRAAAMATSVAALRTESSLGVGDFDDLKMLIDVALKCGMNAVSLLPVNDTSVTAVHVANDFDPFAPISGFALHPLYLSIPPIIPPELADLHDECATLRGELLGLAKLRETINGPEIDYNLVLTRKLAMVREIFEETRTSVMRKRDFQAYVRRAGEWLAPYALFCALRDEHGTGDWHTWPAEFQGLTSDDVDRLTGPESAYFDDVAFYCYLQFVLDAQLRAARRYGEEKGVALIGTMPISVRTASADRWLQPKQFCAAPARAAHPPAPDASRGRALAFLGLAIPRWTTMRADGYAWWRRRIHWLSGMFHGLRLAHPVDFVRAWRIDNDEEVLDTNVQIAENAAFGHHWPADALTREDFAAAGVAPDRAEAWALGDRNAVFVHDVDYRAAQTASCDDAEALARLEAMDTPLYHPRPEYRSLPGFLSLPRAEQSAVEVLARTYEQRNALEWRAAAMERLPKIFDRCDALLFAEAEKRRVPMALRQTLDALGVLLVREADRHASAIKGAPPRGSRIGARSTYVGAVSAGGAEYHSARSWWAAERGGAERVYRALGHKDEVPAELPREAAILMLGAALGGEAKSKARQLVSLETGAMRASGDDAMVAFVAMHDILPLSKNDARSLVPAARDRACSHEDGEPTWRYRMPIGLEDMLADDAMCKTMHALVCASGRSIEHSL